MLSATAPHGTRIQTVQFLKLGPVIRLSRDAYNVYLVYLVVFLLVSKFASATLISQLLPLSYLRMYSSYFDSPQGYAILGTLFTWGMTAAGSSLVFFINATEVKIYFKTLSYPF